MVDHKKRMRIAWFFIDLDVEVVEILRGVKNILLVVQAKIFYAAIFFSNVQLFLKNGEILRG